MSKKKCLYCGKAITRDLNYYNMKNYCSLQCKNNYDKFDKDGKGLAKKTIISIILMVITLFLGLILIAINKHLEVAVVFIASVGFFVTMVIFLFATPETVKLFGLKKSMWIVRVFALLMLLWIFTVILDSFGVNIF